MTNKFGFSGRFSRRVKRAAKMASRRKGGQCRWLLGTAIALSVAVIGQLPNHNRIEASGDGKPFFNFQDQRQMSVSFRGADSATRALQSAQAEPRALASADLDGNGTPDVIAGYASGETGIVTIQRGNPDAFAPADDSVFQRLVQGYNPDSLLPQAEVYPVPVPADLLIIGNFAHRSGKDILFAAKGGALYLMPGDARGGYGVPEQITLPGSVTALAVGEFRAADGFTDVAVGIAGPRGEALLVFDGMEGFSEPLVQYHLNESASGIEFGGLDDDPFLDVAVAAGSELLVVHGWGRKELASPALHVERIKFSSTLRGLAVGEFTWDRAGRSEMAALTDDGAVQIVRHENLDTRPFTESEKAERTRGKIKVNSTNRSVDVESVRSWQPGQSAGWTKSDRHTAGGVSSASFKSLLRTHLSRREMDDLMLIGENQSTLELLHPTGPNDLAPDANSSTNDLVRATLDTASEPLAVLPLPQKLNGVIDLVVLRTGIATPSIIPTPPNTTITVDRTDDPSGAGLTAASACTAAGNDCSLRGAFQFANAPANPGTTIMLAAGTYILTINGTNAGGCDGNTVGDLGANQSTTITGAGAATTIIRQTGTGPANDGDRIMCMNEPFTLSLIYTFSGVTFVGGREGTAAGGGAVLGGAGIIGGELNNSLTMTNVVMANNQETVAGSANLGGGGLQITGGNLIITNSTFGGSSAPGAYAERTSTTTGNVQTGSGGGITYTPSSPQHSGGSGTLTITGSTFSRNTAAGIGGGGADLLIFAFAAPGGIGSGSANISTSTFSNNQAVGTPGSGTGGGIVVESLPTTVATTNFTNNTAGNRGGGIYVGGGSLLLNGATPSITFSGNTATSGGSSISTAGPVNVDGTNTTIGGDIEMSTGGIWTNNAGSTLAPTNVVLTGGTLNMNNSTMNVAGNLTIGAAAIVGATFNGNTGTVNIQGNFVLNPPGGTPATTLNAGTGTFNFNGTGAQSITNGTSITFFNLTDSNTTQPLTFNNSLAVNGNLTANGATATLAPVAGTVISGTGTLTGTGTARVTRIAATADFLSQYTITNKTLTNLTVDYVGTAAQVLSAFTYGPLKITNANGVNLGGTATVNGLLTLTSGALGVGTNTLNINNGSSVGAGSLTSGATGTVNYGQGSNGQSVLAANYGNLTFSNFTKTLPSVGTVQIRGTFTTGAAGGHTLAGSTVEFNGASAQTLPSNFTTYNNLTLNNTAGVTGFAGLIVQNLLRVQAGTFTSSSTYNNVQIDSGAILAGVAATTINITGNWTNNGTFNANGNTVNFNGSALQSLGGSSATTFNNLTINNGAGVNLGNNATVAGTLTLTSGALAVGTSTLTINGAATAGGGSLTSGVAGTVNYNQSSNGQAVLAFNYGNLTFSNFNKTLPASGTVGIAGVFTTGSATGHTITSSTVDFNGGGSQTVPVFTYNNLTSSNSGMRTLASSGIIKIASAFTPGTNTYIITGSTLEFNGTAAQTLPSGFTPYNNLTLNNVAGVTGFAGLTVQGLLRVQAGTFTSSSTYKDVQIDAGATLAAASGSTINVSGAWTNNGTFTPNDGTVNFNGSLAQSLGGSSTTAFNNLTINNASGVTLNANITINATLTLTAGALAIGSRTLTLNNGITITSGSFTSAANGTVNYNQSSNGQNVAPGNYGNLTFSDFTKTLPSSGSVKIAGTFTVGAAGGHTITGSTVEYNGAAAQTIPAAFTTYNNLTLNNVSGVTGFSGLTVQGLLRVQAGTFTTSSSFKDVQIDSGATLAATAASTINVSGNWSNSGTFTANTGTVNFNGAAAQTMSGSSTTTFNNLTISNAAGVSLSTNETVNSALTLTSGALSVGAQTLTLNGAASATSGSITSSANGTVNYNQSTNGQAVLAANYGNLTFSNLTKTLASSGTTRIAGAFTTGAAGGHTVTGSTVEYNGSGAQIAPSGFSTYDNLTINNPAGVSLGGNAIVGGLLSLTNGNLNAGANTMELTTTGTISRTSGHVLGNLKKNFAASGLFIYHVGTANGYSPADVNVTAGTGNLTVTAVQAPQPILNATKSLQRYWTLSGSGITADLTFHYLDGDVMGNESIYRLIKTSGATAVIFPANPPTVDPANNIAFTTGVQSFSDWSAGEPTAPTAVDSVLINASGYDAGTLIEWQTASEVNNLGFNIYREEDGKRALVNPQIVAGSALLAGSGVTLGAGRSYGWWDSGATSRAQYWIEDLDLNGGRTIHGPVSAKHLGGAPSLKSSAAMLPQVGVTLSGISKPVPITAAFSVVRPDRVNIVSSLAAQPAVKLAVKYDGYYRVPSVDLVAAGIEPNADPVRLQLYVDGKQVPIRVLTDGQGLISSVEFYGVGLDTAETDARVYWLISGSEPGLRIPQLKSSGVATGATSFLYAIERRDRTVYFSALRNGELGNFFGSVISSEPVDQTLVLPNLDSIPNAQATVDVALQGVTTAQHRVWAYVNGTFAGELRFDGQAQGQARLSLAQSELREGNNVIRFVAQGGPADVSLVDYTRISYWHKFVADDNALRLTVEGGQKTTVSGFSNPAVRVFDVTNSDSVEEIATEVEPNKGVFSATFASPRSGERKLLAISDDRANRPATVTANRPSNLRALNHAAAFVIITRRDFFPAFESLAQLRASQGIKSELVDPEDIYDEFSFGNKSPQAVKDFLQYAKANWKTGPKFVLLGADSSYDPRNYLGFGDWDIAPSKLIDTSLMETDSDDWFVDFNNDGLPELAVGRLPARSVEEASALVQKIVNYQASSPSEEMLLVADLSDTFDFERVNADLKASIPSNLRVNEINRGNLDPAKARSLLMEAINRGQKVVNYSGHGSVTLWRGGLLTNEDATLMENREHPSLFILMTCLNGYGYDPVLDSLAESLMKAEGGAIAVWSSSGMTDPDEQAVMNRALYALLFGENGRNMTIGEMVVKAKESTSNSDVRRSWIMIGDPTMKIR
jgi:predicted outer membrane repeat protein